MDDFVNQSEDAVALGYRVLEQTIEEIKEGYKEAQAFNRKQEEFERQQQKFEAGEGPRPVEPTIPWEKMVDRVQSLQNIALDAVKDGTEIFFDSIKSATKSTRSLAKTWEKSRDRRRHGSRAGRPGVRGSRGDQGKSGPTARPGRDGRFAIEGSLGSGSTRSSTPSRRKFSGLKVNEPDARGRRRKRKPQSWATSRSASNPRPTPRAYDEVTSLLTVDVGEIPSGQKVGVYRGLIRASNFELLIARLRIHVLEAATDERARARDNAGREPFRCGRGAAKRQTRCRGMRVERTKTTSESKG